MKHFLQGAMRMRDLSESHSLEVLVPKDMKFDDPSSKMQIEKVLSIAQKNQNAKVKEANFRLAMHKMRKILREDLKERIKNEKDVKRKSEMLLAFKPFFIGETVSSPSKLFRKHEEEDLTGKILNAEKEKYLKTWKDCLTAAKLDADPSLVDEKRSMLSRVVKKAEPICDITCKTPTQGKETHATVEAEANVNALASADAQANAEAQAKAQLQAQTKLEAERQSELQNITSDSSRVYPDKDKDYIVMTKLNDYISKMPPELKKPNFSFSPALHVSDNYIKSAQDSMNIFSQERKPIPYIYFHRTKPGGVISAVAITAREAHKLSSEGLPKNSWIITPGEVPYAGKGPDIRSMEYEILLEQIQYLNGDTELLSTKRNNLIWMNENTDEKLEFYESGIAPFYSNKQATLSYLKNYFKNRQPTAAVDSTQGVNHTGEISGIRTIGNIEQDRILKENKTVHENVNAFIQEMLVAGPPIPFPMRVKMRKTVPEVMSQYSNYWNECDEIGQTPIMVFLKSARHDLANELLSKANEDLRNNMLSSKDAFDRDLLEHAILSRSLKIVDYVVNDLKFSVLPHDNKNPLLLALQIGNPHIIKYLIDKGASIESVPNQKSQLLDTAINNCNYETIIILLEKGLIPQLKEVRAILNRFSYDDHTFLLQKLVEYGQLESVKHLLDFKPNIYKLTYPEGKSPLCIAAAKGHLEIAQLFYEEKYIRHLREERHMEDRIQARYMAIKNNQPEMFEYITNKFRWVPSNKMRPLAYALLNDHYEFISKIIDIEYNLNQTIKLPDGSEPTYLQYSIQKATQNQKWEVVRALIEKGAQPTSIQELEELIKQGILPDPITPEVITESQEPSHAQRQTQVEEQNQIQSQEPDQKPNIQRQNQEQTQRPEPEQTQEQEDLAASQQPKHQTQPKPILTAFQSKREQQAATDENTTEPKKPGSKI